MPAKVMRPTNRAMTSPSSRPSAARARARSSLSLAKSLQCTPSGITGSCGGAIRTCGPSRQRSISVCVSCTCRTVSRTASEVQIRASHGITGSTRSLAMLVMARSVAVVWVMPHRL